MVMLNSIFILLIVFQLKHFIADYPLQGKYMLKKFASGTEWILPLLAHAAVHAVMTFTIALVFGASLGLSVLVALLDMSLHFTMDRIKASPEMLGRYQAISKGEYQGLMTSRAMCLDGIKYTAKPELVEESQRRLDEIDNRFKSNVKFWWALGVDQGVHHLTHYLVIYMLVR